MPLYEYQCEACGHRFETIQKFSDPLIEACPKCGGTVRKLQSAPAFQFKGTGWYITDYAKKDAAASAGEGGAKDGAGKESASKESSAKESSAKEGAATNVKTDTKTETKKETKSESAPAKADKT